MQVEKEKKGKYYFMVMFINTSVWSLTYVLGTKEDKEEEEKEEEKNKNKYIYIYIYIYMYVCIYIYIYQILV